MLVAAVLAAVWHEDSMCTCSATQLDPTEKDNLMRYKCGFCNRIWLSGNNCLARRDGAFLLFVTTSECATCLNFVNSCCQGCERTGLKRNVDQNAAKQEEFSASIQDVEVTFESTPKETQLRQALGKSSFPAVGAGVEGEVEAKHETSWSLLAVRCRGDGRETTPEGGRREDAQAWQVSVSWHWARREAWQVCGDRECGRRRLDQARDNVCG